MKINYTCLMQIEGIDGSFHGEDSRGQTKYVAPKVEEPKDNWISVKDRLPDNGQEVLTYSFEFDFNFYEVLKFDVGFRYTDGYPCPNISHWQPLSPPKQ